LGLYRSFRPHHNKKGAARGAFFARNIGIARFTPTQALPAGPDPPGPASARRVRASGASSISANSRLTRMLSCRTFREAAWRRWRWRSLATFSFISAMVIANGTL
jgi:hypothetical protein